MELIGPETDDEEEDESTDPEFSLAQMDDSKDSTLDSYEYFIVSKEFIRSVLVRCEQCGCAVQELRSFVRGFSIGGVYTCVLGHKVQWGSSAFHHKIAEINVLLPSAFILNGCGFEELKSVMKTLKMPTQTNGSFFSHVKKWTYPAISKQFLLQQTRIVEGLKKLPSECVISGDGQFDSPGHCAKYCAWTAAEQSTGYVVDFHVVQKRQYTGELEKHACRETLLKLKGQHALEISKVVTDRHAGIGKMMREDFKGIEHEYDIWHFAKSIKKKLTKLAKKFPELKPWFKNITNHFWFCCQKCNGDGDLLLELWHSTLLHMTNQHTWKRQNLLAKKYGNFIGTGKPYPQPFRAVKECFHPRLSRAQNRATQWLKPDSPAFAALAKMFTDTRMCNEMKLCKSFIHTGEIENLHSVKNKFLPKRKHFSLDTHIIMLMLVSIEHNAHIDARNGGKIKVRKSVEFSKAACDYLLKKKYIKDAIPGKIEILNTIKADLKSGKHAKLGDILAPYKTMPVPKNINPPDVQKPSVSELTQRFSKFKSDGIVVPPRPPSSAAPSIAATFGRGRPRARARASTVRGRGSRARATGRAATVRGRGISNGTARGQGRQIRGGRRGGRRSRG